MQDNTDIHKKTQIYEERVFKMAEKSEEPFSLTPGLDANSDVFDRPDKLSCSLHGLSNY
jgi:hypothetical protein